MGTLIYGRCNTQTRNSTNQKLIQGLPSAGPCFPLHRHHFSRDTCLISFLNESFECSEKGPRAIEERRSPKPVSPGPGHNHCLKYISRCFACPSFKCHTHQLGFLPMSPATAPCTSRAWNQRGSNSYPSPQSQLPHLRSRVLCLPWPWRRCVMGTLTLTTVLGI